MLPDVAVPNYNDVYASLGSTYDPQAALVQQQLGDIPRQQQAQMSALDQAKVNAFRDIDTSANRKGILFSGFSPDQQAQYVGTKYLPAVANLQTSINNQKTSLLDKVNQINAARQQQAQGIVAGAQKQAADNAYRNAQLAMQQQRLDASRASAAAKPLTQVQVSAAIRQGLGSVRGKDGYVSPQDYAQAYKDWVTAGYSGDAFDNYFGDLMNPKNGYYQYAKTRA